MKSLPAVGGGMAGLIAGFAAEFRVALLVAKPRFDGIFVVREMLVCLPRGTVFGNLAGSALGWTGGA